MARESFGRSSVAWILLSAKMLSRPRCDRGPPERVQCRQQRARTENEDRGTSGKLGWLLRTGSRCTSFSPDNTRPPHRQDPTEERASTIYRRWNNPQGECSPTKQSSNRRRRADQINRPP